MAQRPSTKKHRAYGPFAIAAAIYTLGVVVFSAWSYFQHRTILLTHIDESLVHATHATEQILGRAFITNTITTESYNEGDYTDNQAELKQFAEAGHFDLIMAAAIKGTNLWEIIGGIDPQGVVADAETVFQDPIHSATVAETLHLLAAASVPDLRVLDLYHEAYGSLRIAVRYEPISPATGYALVAVRSVDSMERLMRTQITSKIANGLFLLLMAFPLIALYTRARVISSKQLADLNERLRQDVELQKKREIELKDAIHDLERFNAVAVGREGRIIELKAEVNTLLKQAGKPRRYTVDHKE